MSATSSTELDALIERATSESIPHGDLDLPLALEVSDVVRSRRLAPKESMRCLKRRVMNTSDNPNVQLSSWRLIDICIKNGGFPFIKEVCSREFLDTMEYTLLKKSDNAEVASLVARILYELHVALKNDLQFSYVNRVYEKLLSRGVSFPKDVQTGTLPLTMLDSRTPADWVDSDACMLCSKKFSLFLRRHHCRSCGGIFCQDHSSNNIVLSDLGIPEPVRVCDRCFEDYEMKKRPPSDKKKRHVVKRKKSRSQIYDEDEELKKAIELSLKESKGDVEATASKKANHSTPPPKIETAEEEEDPDLKAAIAASLALAEKEKRRKQADQRQEEEQQHQRAQLQQQELWNQQTEQRQSPALDVSTAEEEDIHLFASLVERMKGQSPTDILDNLQLQRLYQKVIGSRPKINHALNDTVQKYNSLIDMNTKISDIMNIYDDLLEKQLRNIELSERYVVPQGPSDPYAYYNETSSAPSAPIGNQRAAEVLPQPTATRMAPQSHATALHHLDQIRDIQIPVPERITSRPNLSNVSPERPYPIAEEGPGTPTPTPEELAYQQGDKASGPNVAVPPYPVTEDTSNTEDQNEITNFDFPTVPARKVVQRELESEAEQIKSSSHPKEEEELLIEL